MYIPTSFTQPDPSRLQAFIEGHPFGLLVSNVEGVPFATHLPFLLARNNGPQGQLIGHLARANPHGRELEGQTVLAIFSGPHAYISPTWYEAENVVPTWNYMAVHAYGICRVIEGHTELAEILTASVATFEGSLPAPWALETQSDFFARLLQGIVGFRIDITRLEGKWKLSQNHPRERREKVLRALRGSGDPGVQEMVREMENELA